MLVSKQSGAPFDRFLQFSTTTSEMPETPSQRAFVCPRKKWTQLWSPLQSLEGALLHGRNRDFSKDAGKKDPNPSGWSLSSMSHEVRALVWNLGLVFIDSILLEFVKGNNILHPSKSWTSCSRGQAWTSMAFNSGVAPVLSSSSSDTFDVCQCSDLLKSKQRHTLSSSTHRTNNYVRQHSLAIISISFNVFTKERWRSLSADGLNEALLSTMGIGASLGNRKKPSSGPVWVQKVGHSGWLTWNWICSHPNSWHLQWQSEGQKHEGLLPASRHSLVKSLRSDAHIVVLRNKHGKNSCSLSTYYTQPLFLSCSFFFLRTVSNKKAECVGHVEQSL